MTLTPTARFERLLQALGQASLSGMNAGILGKMIALGKILLDLVHFAAIAQPLSDRQILIRSCLPRTSSDVGCASGVGNTLHLHRPQNVLLVFTRIQVVRR